MGWIWITHESGCDYNHGYHALTKWEDLFFVDFMLDISVAFNGGLHQQRWSWSPPSKGCPPSDVQVVYNPQ